MLQICVTVAWLALLVRCDHGFSKFGTELNDSASLESGREDWNGEDVSFNRGYGQNSSKSGPIVVTPCGTYKGRYGGDKKGCKYEKFLGIQYAQPPVGPLRFQPPVPGDCTPDAENSATEYGPPCMQPRDKARKKCGMESSEDCLYLNIYRRANTGPEDNYPVLVYVHESYFLYGCASQPELNGGCLADMGKIIVVTCNYRLGAFGWLNGQNEVIGGNVGGFDIAACILFTKQIISSFGGDPGMVTLGGHGSGGAISMASLFEGDLPRDLVQKVMIMSPFFNQLSYKDSPLIALEKSNVFLKLIECNDPKMNETSNSDPKATPFSPTETACAMATDAVTLAEASDKLPYYDGNGICSHSQLTINYIVMSYDEQLKKGMFFKDKCIFAGNVITEFKKSLSGSKVKTKGEGAQRIAETVTPIIDDQRKENVKKIIDFYLGSIDKEDSFAVGKRTTLALNHVCYNCLTEEMEKYLSIFGQEVYAYRYKYVASCDKDDPKRIYGAYHLDDVPFGFGLPFRDREKYNDYDREVSRAVIDIWSDFVSGDKMQWPPYDKKDRYTGIIKGDEKSNYYETSPYTEVCRRLDA